jgi:peptidoglycan/LPS O-acetylase OafA/YrhL
LSVFIGRLAAAGPLAWLVLALGLLAAVLMVATEFSTIQSIRIGQSTCGASDPDIRDVCETSGGDAHNWSLLLLGVLTALLAFGAAVGRSRPAAVALGVVGLIVLAIALLVDRPDLDNLRNIETRYNDAEAITGGGYKLELIAGALAVVACGVALVRERVAPQEKFRRREGREREAPAEDAAAPDPAA